MKRRHWTDGLCTRTANVLRAHTGARYQLNDKDFKNKSAFASAFKAGRIKVGTNYGKYAVVNLGHRGIEEICLWLKRA